jgi:hypothetical protein
MYIFGAFNFFLNDLFSSCCCDDFLEFLFYLV